MADIDTSAEAVERINDYDCGLINDYGGGNVDWWMDYLRAEIGRANDHWRDAARQLVPALSRDLEAMRAERDAAIARAEQAEARVAELEGALMVTSDVPTWQPIDTAPKDGDTILVCLPRMMNLIVRASYSRVYGYWRTDCGNDGGITNPTFFHQGDVWMPLPKPPDPAALSQEGWE